MLDMPALEAACLGIRGYLSPCGLGQANIPSGQQRTGFKSSAEAETCVNQISCIALMLYVS